MKETSGIYLIEIKEKIYIGSATNLYQRKCRHIHDLKHNKHCNRKLQNAFNKYGLDNLFFNVLEYCTIENLILREQYFIDTKTPFFNICKTAGNTKGFLHSENTKLYLSKIRKGKQNSLGRVLSKETKEKISKKAKERGISEQFKKASIKANKGSKHTKERRYKIAVSQAKIKPIDIEDIKNMYKSGIYQKDIAKKYNVSQRLICRVINNIGIYGNNTYELDIDYFNQGNKRFENFTKQLTLF